MSNEVQKPTPMTWELDDSLDDSEDDFLKDAEAQEAPKACSISEPDCEACQ